MWFKLVLKKKLIKAKLNEKNKKIVLPSKVVSVADRVFASCNHLEEVIIPEGLKELGVGSFSRCKNLKKINLASSVNQIGTDSFEYCTSLEEIELPESLITIPRGVFNNCRNLKSIKFNDKLEGISISSFDTCTSLEEVSFSDKIKYIADYSFNNCKNLKRVRLPKNSNSSIGTKAFYNCHNIESVIIPDYRLLFSSGVEKLLQDFDSYYINENNGELLTLKNPKKFVEGYKRINYKSFYKNLDKDIYSKQDAIVLYSMFSLEELKRLKQLNMIMPYIVKYRVNSDNYKLISETLKNNSKEFIHLLEKINKNYYIEDSRILYDLYNLANSLGVFNDDQVERQRACEFLSNAIDKKIIDVKHIHSSFESLIPNDFHNKEWADFFMNKNNFKSLVEMEKNHRGYISRIHNNFLKIKEFGRSNRGDQHYRKVTLKMCEDYFLSGSFTGIDRNNLDIAKTISFYTRAQSTFEEATSIRNEYLELRKNKEIKDHILGEPLFSEIENERRNIINDIKDNLSNLNKVSNNRFTYEYLSKYDPKNFILGKYCTCCAHLEGVGKGIMKASILHPDCQNLVIKDEYGVIIAKSTLYINRKRGYGVFNNIEINSRLDKESKDMIYEKYMEAVNDFAQKYNSKNSTRPIRQINVGMRFNDLKEQLKENNEKATRKLEGLDFSYYYGEYSGDWQKEQYIVWKNENINDKKGVGR